MIKKWFRRLMWRLFPSLLPGVLVKEDVRFVNSVNKVALVTMLISDEFRYFMDDVERSARLAVGGTPKDKLYNTYRYEGVRLVSERAREIVENSTEKKTNQTFASALGLDDASLLKEFNAYGKGNRGQA